MGALTNGITIDNRATTEEKPIPGLMILALVLGVLLLVRIAALALTTADLHSDEAQYWWWAKDFAIADISRPPLVIWLVGMTSGLCGDGETCIRLSSPIIFTLAAFLIYPLARRLYDSRVAFWAAIVFATLPAVSVFSMVAMPEAALSLIWIVGLSILSIHLVRPNLASGFTLGLTIGFGLLTDYLTIYLPLCTVLFLAATPEKRAIFRAPGTWLAGAAAFLVVAPYLAWSTQIENISFGLAGFLSDWTFRHLNPDATLVFVALQFVLFGPILFFLLLRAALMRAAAPFADSDRFLLWHSMPIFAVLFFQVLFFRARADWSIPAFPAAAIFVTALLVRYRLHRLLSASIGLHIAVLAGVFALSVFANRLDDVPFFDRMVGWREFAEKLSEAAALSDINTIVLQGESKVAEAAYYLRDTEIEILAFGGTGTERNWTYGDPETVLLATERDPSAFGIPLGNADRIGEFPSQTWLSQDGVFALFRINPPTEAPPAQ